MSANSNCIPPVIIADVTDKARSRKLKIDQLRMDLNKINEQFNDAVRRHNGLVSEMHQAVAFLDQHAPRQKGSWHEELLPGEGDGSVPPMRRLSAGQAVVDPAGGGRHG